MMTILDDVKSRVEKYQTFNTRRRAAFRRCNTELRPNHPMNDKKPTDLITDEKEKLRKHLSASLAARKSLEMMISGLGKEKKIMASELARKVSELNEMEELISDLKSQNENLLGKLQSCVKQHKEKKSSGGGDVQGNAALQERNKALSEQLMRSLDGYRYLKRKYKDLKEENVALHATMEEMGAEVMSGLDRVHRLKQRVGKGNDQAVDIDGEISELVHMFKGFSMKISKDV
ncbi:centrosomal protein [Tripterygium wilfordii]|uniref:Centrosomal protein n=2 Tax=Tripterygium wilfordii TaxID=458696 RepID=A0A7J7CQI1_TRIWF|nr:centrosomal protein [Tripterygium wilfordii]